MTEVWLPVVGFEGYYEVSDAGRVRSVSREFTQKGKRGALCHRKLEGRVLKGSLDGYGYRTVRLSAPTENGGLRKQKKSKICWLVLESFVGPRPYKHDVCHNNGDRKDDRLSNLRYGTRKENVQDAKEHGTFPCGERNGQSKLTWDCARAIRKLYEEFGLSMDSLARAFSVSTTTIFNVVHNKVWSDE